MNNNSWTNASLLMSIANRYLNSINVPDIYRLEIFLEVCERFIAKLIPLSDLFLKSYSGLPTLKQHAFFEQANDR